jgi:hypothetical protein
MPLPMPDRQSFNEENGEKKEDPKTRKNIFRENLSKKTQKEEYPILEMPVLWHF